MADESEQMDVDENEVKTTAKWLVNRAKQSLKDNNIFEAKSWLLTAKTLYPKDFHVQHEAYNIERNTKRVKESANLFYEMFVHFPSESLLWEDIQNLTVALEETDLDSSKEFLKEMFNCLPQSAQREILLQAAGRCKDCIEKCRMMLLLMRRFPDSVPKNGITLTDMLIDAENIEYPTNPLNPYRKLLVCDVLPHLLTSESIEVEGEWSQDQQSEGHKPTTISLQTALKWLELSIQFYSFCATYTQVPSTSDGQLMSPTLTASSQGTEVRDIVTSVHEEKGTWFALYEIFCHIAKKCKWTEILKVQDKLDPFVHRSIKERWSCISEIHHFLKKAAKHGTSGRDINETQEKTGVFYATIMIFFQSVWEYCKIVNKLDSTGNPTLTPSTPLVLIEDVSTESWPGGSPSETSSSASRRKKKKGSSAPLSPSREEQRAKQPVTIVVSKNCGNISSSIPDDFVVSVDTWHILNTHVDYKNDFTRVLTEWHTDQWIWMETFKVDRMVYKAKYKKVVDFLKDQKTFLQADPSPVHQEICGRWSFQLSCCYFYLAEYKNACTEALDALLLFSNLNTSEAKALKRTLSTVYATASRDLTPLVQLTTQGRYLQLIPCTEVEALSFCVRLLITCLKQKVSHEGRSGDFVGHMIVLLQYDWPKEQRTFYDLLDRIRSHGGLTYRRFFDFIINIDVLEEFAYLNSEGVLKLELIPKSTTSSRSRTVTRGVNKGAKEDFRSAMEKQVSRCEENVDALLRTFLEEERDSIVSIF